MLSPLQHLPQCIVFDTCACTCMPSDRISTAEASISRHRYRGHKVAVEVGGFAVIASAKFSLAQPSQIRTRPPESRAVISCSALPPSPRSPSHLNHPYPSTTTYLPTPPLLTISLPSLHLQLSSSQLIFFLPPRSLTLPICPPRGGGTGTESVGWWWWWLLWRCAGSYADDR